MLSFLKSESHKGETAGDSMLLFVISVFFQFQDPLSLGKKYGLGGVSAKGEKKYLLELNYAIFFASVMFACRRKKLGGGNSNVFLMFTPKIEEDEPILRSICFKAVVTIN